MLSTDQNHPLLLGLRRSRLIMPGARVLVALSGGPDSTAMLVAAREEGHDVVAAHYDHALRSGSESVAEHVREMCVRLGVDILIERRREALPRGSVQAGARTLRYEFLERARSQAGADLVAVAHTADDLVEGAVMHLMRGCGLAGLLGMPASRGSFIRPLLHVWRSEVVDFLGRRRIVALEDPANSDTVYARVRVRHEILPALERDRPGIGRRFYAAAVRAAAIQELISSQAAAAIKARSPNRSLIADMPEPVALETMRLLYTEAGGAEPALSRRQLRSMLSLTESRRGARSLDLPGGFRFRIVNDLVEVVAPGSDARHETRRDPRLVVTQCSGCDVPETAHLKSGLVLHVGFRRPGLRMRPLGGRGTRKLQDIFVDARVPREERDVWPLVFAGETLAWVPGIAIDADLASKPGEPALHASVICESPDRRRESSPVLVSPDSTRGEPT